MAHTKSITTSLLLSLTLIATFTPPLGCATNRTAGRRINDRNVSMAVGSKLLRDPEVNRFRIDVDARDGTVVLRGEVPSEEHRREAERLAKNTDGVERVINELEVVDEPYTAETAFDDAWIVTMVSGKLARDPMVKSRNVDVDANRGVVTLSGTVENRRARREAEALAESVDGVMLVVNELETAR